MIITRSPLRITLGGGGTDLPSYYQGHGGFVCSAAINKYVYITLHQTFFEDLILKYSRMERVRSLADIEHPLIREALSLVGQQAGGLEITSMSDIPAGTGLGSSASFLTALLYALHVNAKSLVPRQELAEQACHIEMVRLGEPVGKQDQYIAAFGGLTTFDFAQDGTVVVTPLRISAETTANLEDNLILFYTGFTRSAASILGEQDERSRRGDLEMTLVGRVSVLLYRRQYPASPRDAGGRTSRSANALRLSGHDSGHAVLRLVMLPCVILCGGLATGLYPLTEQMPKSLVQVNGRPFLFHQLELLRSQGIRDAILCIGHLGDSIQAYAGDGSPFGIQLRYSSDAHLRLGTAGAVRKALAHLPSRSLCIMVTLTSSAITRRSLNPFASPANEL